MVDARRSVNLCPTAIISVKNQQGKYIKARALLDSGAAVTVIRDSLVSTLNLHRQRDSCYIYGVGNNKVSQPGERVKIVIKPTDRPVPIVSTSALVMYQLTGDIPSVYYEAKDILSQLNQIQLADQDFGVPRDVDLIIGTDILNYVYDGTRINLNSSMAAYGTCFGYVLLGSAKKAVRQNDTGCTNSSVQTNSSTSVLSYGTQVSTLEEAVERFWKSEEPPTEKVNHPLHQECEDLYRTTTIRMPDGKYMVRLPLLSDRPQLGDSRQNAMQRFKALERKMEKTPIFAQKYREFMSEYLELGHMSESNFNCESEHYFIPHHGIFKKGSEKLRVVFDGACKTSNGVSINQCLHSGAPLQNDITKIIINFRRYQYVFTADIKQMFRQTWIYPSDRRYQLILWRATTSEPIKVYELNTNTYGLRSSPFVSIRTMHQLADDWEVDHPGSVVSSIIKHQTFVDDILGGANSFSEAQDLKNELIKVMNSTGYELRKWSSNHTKLLEDLPGDHCETPHQFDGEDKSFIKVLGIQWDPSSDTFSYQINVPSGKAITKRNILSTIARLYDPCGYCNPVILRFKNLLQTLFMDGLNWDDPVPQSVSLQWEEMIRDLQYLSHLTLPRCVVISDAVSHSLHGMGDASEAGFAACVYLRSVDSSGRVMVRLVMAKSKVAPKKNRQTIPKLELSAAHLVCKLLNHVASSLEDSIKLESINAWSDSSIVLTWLKSQPHQLQTFEGNRVQYIQNSERNITWRHIIGTYNPADCASRGMSAKELISHQLWWSPPWLHEEMEDWPRSVINTPEDMPGYKKTVHVTTPVVSWDLDLLEKVSSFSKLINVTAFVIRYIRNLRLPKDQRNFSKVLSLEETRNAIKHWIRRIQSTSFSSEINSIKRRKSVCTSLQKLSIFLDEEDLIRVGGRIKNSVLPYGTRHQYLLPKDHRFVQLLIEHYHKSYCHAATTALIAIIRREYWITSVRRQVSRVIRKCITCFRFSPTIISPPFMGDLPADRVTAARPFAGTSTDFGGPYLVKSSLLRNAKSVKCYFVTFVCTGTRACHVEAVSSLSVEAFIAAFTRFVSRRGLPSLIRSDNATNYVGADSYLKEVNQFLLNNEVILREEFNRQNINWLYAPPTGSHFSGLHEASVKSIKQLLKREIGETILTFEEFSTLLSKVEAILNSRPLVAMSEDPCDLDVLTPGHFLIGQPLVALPEFVWKDTKMSRLSRYQTIQKMSQNIFSRYQKEYLTSLQTRHKWFTQSDNVKVGDLVLIVDNNSVPLHWRRGRIIEIFPGKDNVVRSVKLKTQSGEFIRPVVKLCKLPVDLD